VFGEEPHRRLGDEPLALFRPQAAAAGQARRSDGLTPGFSVARQVVGSFALVAGSGPVPRIDGAALTDTF
jgi:hypothetical protein